MEWFDKEKRFNELFNDWFDNQFRKYLASNREQVYCMVNREYKLGMAAAYAAIDDWIDSSIESIRQQVNWEFEDWKKSFLGQEE